MNRSPIVPYILIMVFGIALVFGLSLKGLGDAKEVADGGKDGGAEEQNEQASASPEEIYAQSCVSCHGQNYEGAVGPALKGVGQKLSVDEIKTIIKDGTTGGMPGGLVAEDKIDEMAQWLSELK